MLLRAGFLWRGRKQGAEGDVSGDYKAGPGRVGDFIAACEPLGEGPIAQEHARRLVATDAAPDGLAHRDEVVGHERGPVAVVAEGAESYGPSDDAEPQAPGLVAELLDGVGALAR